MSNQIDDDDALVNALLDDSKDVSDLHNITSSSNNNNNNNTFTSEVVEEDDQGLYEDQDAASPNNNHNANSSGGTGSVALSLATLDPAGLIPLCVQTPGEPTFRADVFGYDIARIQERPWARPGQSAADYFNYGFDEFSWRMYCALQHRGPPSSALRARAEAFLEAVLRSGTESGELNKMLADSTATIMANMMNTIQQQIQASKTQAQQNSNNKNDNDEDADQSQQQDAAKQHQQHEDENDGEHDDNQLSEIFEGNNNNNNAYNNRLLPPPPPPAIIPSGHMNNNNNNNMLMGMNNNNNNINGMNPMMMGMMPGMMNNNTNINLNGMMPPNSNNNINNNPMMNMMMMNNFGNNNNNSNNNNNNSMMNFNSFNGDNNNNNNNNNFGGGASYYKTRLCHQFINTGSCRRGAECLYAHGDADLKQNFGGGAPVSGSGIINSSSSGPGRVMPMMNFNNFNNNAGGNIAPGFQPPPGFSSASSLDDVNRPMQKHRPDE